MRYLDINDMTEMCVIVMATCVLHNFCIEDCSEYLDDVIPEEPDDIDFVA